MGALADWPLPVLLLLAQGIAQLALAWLARRLGRRLGWRIPLLGILLSWGLLAPFLDADPLLVPTDPLAEQVPGIGPSKITGRQTDLVDAVQQFLPWEVEVRRSLANGRLPFWADRIDGGSSPWSNPQAQALSPIAMAARLLPLQHHLLASLALKIQVAFQGTWLLATLLGIGGWPAVVAGASFAWGGGVIAWGLFPHTSAVVWLPWLAAALLRLMRCGGRGPFIAAVASTLSLMIAGHPEVALGSVLSSAWLAVAYRRRRRPWQPGLVRCAVAGLLGIALAAPLLTPFALLVPGSQRARDQQARLDADRRSPTDRWFQSNGQRFFLAPLHPDASGRPYDTRFRGPMAWPNALCGYVGLAALLGSAVALAGKRRRAALVLLAPTVTATVLASRLTPIETVLGLLPWLQLPALARWILPGTLGLALAGALGLQQLARRGLAVGSGAALLIALLLSWLTGAAFRSATLSAIGLLALAIVAQRWRARWIGPIWLAALLLDLGSWARPQLPIGNPWVFYQPTPLIEKLQELTAHGGPWRVVGEGYLAYPAILGVYGLEDPRTHNPLAPVDRLRVLTAAFGFAPTNRRYHSSFDNVEHPLVDFLGVRCLISNRYLAPKLRLLEVARFPERAARLFENPRALPRFFLPRQVVEVDFDELPDWIASLRDGAIVAVPPGDLSPALLGPAKEKQVTVGARLTDRRPGWVQLEIDPAEQPRLLASSVPGPQGWAAHDPRCRPLTTVRVNGAFLGIVVPAGVGNVELSYRPPGLLSGLVIAGLALLSLGTLALLDRRRRPPAARREESALPVGK